MIANRSLILPLILLAIPLSGVGIDIYTPSLPVIAHDFNAHHSLVKISITVYLLGFSLGQLFTGPLSDSYGRRKILLSGLLLFVMFSALAAFAENIHFFIFMRFLQGVSVTTPVVIAKSITTDSFTGEELRKVSAYLVIAWSIGPIIAPVIGAHLQTLIGWKANFYFLAIYGFLIYLLVLLYLPETNRNFIFLNAYNIKNNYIEIVKCKKFIGSALCLAIGYSQIVIFCVLGPFIIQEVLGYSAVIYGHIALLIGGACLSGSILNRLLIKNFSQDALISWGIFLTLAMSSVLFSFAIFLPLSLLKLILPVFVMLLCVGVIYPSSAISLSMFPKMAGSASAVMGVITILGAALTTSIASIVESLTIVPLASLYLFLAVSMLTVFIFFVKPKSKEFSK